VTGPEDFAPRPADDEIYQSKGERPFSTLINGLADDLLRLFRLEVALLRREMGGNARRFCVGLAVLAVGAVLALTAWFAVFAAAVIALTIIWPAWLAAVVIGAATFIAAGLLLYFGIRSMRAQKLVPRHTLNTLREDGVWIRERLP
jgi:hypothetical protein